MTHCCEAPRSMLSNYFGKQEKYLEVLLGKSGTYKSKYTLKTSIEPIYGAFNLKTKSVPLD